MTSEHGVVSPRPRVPPVLGEELDRATADLLAKLRGFRGDDLNVFSTLAAIRGRCANGRRSGPRSSIAAIYPRAIVNCSSCVPQ